MPSDFGHLETVLDRIEARIASSMDIPITNVYDTLDPEQPPKIRKGEVMVTLCPRDFPIDQGQFAGGGRHIFVAEGILEISCWTRLHLDQPGTSPQYFKNQERGAIIVLRKLLNALTWKGDPAFAGDTDFGWQPQVENSTDPTAKTNLLVEPMRLVRFASIAGQKETDVRRALTVWEVKINLLLP